MALLDHFPQSLSHSRILLIDDSSPNTRFIVRLLEMAGFSSVRTVSDSRLAQAEFTQFQPDIVLVDLHMPHVDGFQILSELRQAELEATFLPILIFTGDSNDDIKRRALALGATDFLTKPGDPGEILQRIKNFLASRANWLELRDQNLTLERRVRERTAELEEARLEIFAKLALVCEFRDDETGEHIRRVRALSRGIAIAYGLSLDESDLIGLASELHDVGKIGIPDNILQKPGRLTPAEFELMQVHTEIGGRLLDKSKTPLLTMAAQIARFHHENWDGSGYTRGLIGEEIPLCARIVAVADVFDALTSARCYKQAWTEDKAFEEIHALSNSKFDPEVVNAFFKSTARPSGSKAGEEL
jgi:putative two-component system response regulator